MYKKRPHQLTHQNIKTAAYTPNNIAKDPSVRKLSFLDRKPLQDRSYNVSVYLQRKGSSANKTVPYRYLYQLEKHAIKLFYDKQYEESFHVLELCESQASCLDSIEHKTYIWYLTAYFYFKLKQYTYCLEYIKKSRSITSNNPKIAQYVLNMECLYLSILSEQNNNQEVLRLADNAICRLEDGNTTWLQATYCKIKALMAVGNNYEAEIEIRNALKYTQKTNDRLKFGMKLVRCLEDKEDWIEARKEIEYMIHLETDEQNQRQLYSKMTYISLQLSDPMGAIFGLEKMLKIVESGTEGKECSCHLARLYSEVGCDRKAVELLKPYADELTFDQSILFAECQYRLNCRRECLKLLKSILYREKAEELRLRVYVKMLPLIDINELSAYEQYFLRESKDNFTGYSVIMLTEYANYLRKQGNFSRSEYFYEHASELSVSIGLPEYTFVILTNMGYMMEDLAKKNYSLRYYRKALYLQVDHELLTSIEERVKLLADN